MSSTVAPPYARAVNYIAMQLRLQKKTQRKAAPVVPAVSVAVQAAEVAAATFCEILNKRSDKIIEFTISRIDSVVEKLTVILKETENDIKKKMTAQIDETRTTSRTVMYDIANDFDAKQKDMHKDFKKEIDRIRHDMADMADEVDEVKAVVMESDDSDDDAAGEGEFNFAGMKRRRSS